MGSLSSPNLIKDVYTTIVFRKSDGKFYRDDGTNDVELFNPTVLDEDNMASNSATSLSTQQSIKAYVDTQITAGDLDISADSGSNIAIILDSEVLAISGGEGIDTSITGNAVTIAGEEAAAGSGSANKGVASFDSSNFAASSGHITIKDAGVILGTETTGNYVATAVAGDGIDVSGATGNVTISGEDATSGNKGIASFSTDNFSVSGGAVTIKDDGVILGTETTGSYVGTITGGAGVDSTAATSGEGTTHTLSLDLNELSTETTIADADFIAMVDATDDGSGKITFENLEDAIFASVSGDIAITEAGVAAIQANSVALTTDTTGNYMVDVSAGTLIDVSHSAGEGSTATVNVDLTEAGEAAIANGDYLLFLDGGATGTHAKEALADVATLFAGAGMTATNSVLNVIGGTGITANANEITTTDGDIVHDNLSGFVANEHIDHSGVTLTAGVGLSGGGTIAANRTFTVDLNELTTEASIAQADFVSMVDETDDGSGKITFSNLEDTVFGNVSGDIAIAAGGAATIQANSVDSDAYVDGSIDLAHMSVNSVDSDQYVDGSIDLIHMSVNSIDSDQYVDGSIDNAHLADDAADSDEIAAGAIDLAHMSVNSIDSDQYVDLSIDNAHIATGLDAVKIADGSVTNAEFQYIGGLTSAAATLASPTFTGNPIAPTQSASNNSTRIATTAYADTAAANLVDSAPAALNTLNELAAALGDDASFSTTVTNSIATKLPLAGGAMTGAITTNSTFDGVDIATRDGVLTSTTTTANAALPKAGGAMTGAITTNSTFDGVDIATRDGVLSSTTTTANAALPKAGGTMSGNVAMGGNDISGGGTITGTFVGGITGNVTGNTSGTAATVTGAAQSSITSLGTLTTLTVDNVIINGATIGHTGDTDLMTVASNVLTVAGEVDATSLDISGDVDVDGTLEADAYTVDGTALNEYISDTVGAMVTSNTESGITVAYQDGDNTLDFTVATLNQDTTGTAATVTGAAQSSITSLGTLTTLTVDNVIINATTIGHTSDTDLMTLADGVLTVAGEISMTTLDIGGTNVTSTAAEINLLDALDRGSILYGNASGVTTVLGQGSADQVLTSDGTDISWATSSAATAGFAVAMAIAL